MVGQVTRENVENTDHEISPLQCISGTFDFHGGWGGGGNHLIPGSTPEEAQAISGGFTNSFTYVRKFFRPFAACALGGRCIGRIRECWCSYDGNLHCPNYKGRRIKANQSDLSLIMALFLH